MSRMAAVEQNSSHISWWFSWTLKIFFQDDDFCFSSKNKVIVLWQVSGLQKLRPSYVSLFCQRQTPVNFPVPSGASFFSF